MLGRTNKRKKDWEKKKAYLKSEQEGESGKLLRRQRNGDKIVFHT